MRRPRLPASFSALAERDFRVVWIGAAISMTGTWMQAVAQSLLVLQLWSAPLALGVMNFVSAVPTVLVMLFGGVLADRVDKRRILMVTQVVLGALAAAVGVLVVTGQARFWMLAVAACLAGVAIGYDLPAYNAYLPELVPPERIGQAVGLNSAAFHGTRMIGPALAGAAIARFGIGTTYFLNAASFVPVVVSLLMVRRRHVARERPARAPALADLRAGLRHAAARPNLRALLILQTLATTWIFPTLAILSPYYVTEVLHESAATLGEAWAVSGVGAVVGALTIVRWPTQARAARLWLAALLRPAAVLVMAVTRSTPIAIAAFGVLSFGVATLGGLIQVMIQESTPGEFRGRVMSLYMLTWSTASPLAGIVAAAAANVVGLPAVMAASAVLALATESVVLALAGGGIRRVVAACAGEYDAALEA